MDLQSSNLNLQPNNGVLPNSHGQSVGDVNAKQSISQNTNSSSTINNDTSSTSVVTKLVSGAQAAAAVYSSFVSERNNASSDIQSQTNSSENVNKANDNSAIKNDSELAKAELKVVQQLAARDREVKTHEQTHAAIGGVHAGSPTYQYESGPDGQLYAVSGQVAIDTSAVENDPRATLEKAQVIIRAALSVAEPSSADRQVASEAKSLALQAIADLASEQNLDASQSTSTQDETVRVEQEQLKREEFRAEEELKQAKLEKDRALAESRKQSTEASVEVLKEFNAEIHEIQETLRRLNTQLVETGAFGKVFPEGALVDQSV